MHARHDSLTAEPPTSPAGFFGASGDADRIADLPRTDNERATGALGHLIPGAILTFTTGGTMGFIVPLFLLFGMRNASPWVRNHIRESLNYQLTLLVFYIGIGLPAVAVMLLAEAAGAPVVAILVGLVTLFFCLILVFMNVIQSVIAGGKAWRGKTYKYRMRIRFFRSVH